MQNQNNNSDSNSNSYDAMHRDLDKRIEARREEQKKTDEYMREKNYQLYLLLNSLTDTPEIKQAYTENRERELKQKHMKALVQGMLNRL